MESKIAELIESTINDLGFELVKVTIHGTVHKILEVLIERKNEEKLQVGDCQVVSRNISAILDVEDMVSGKYFLEVSSTGLERPLVKLQDFERFVDRDIKIRLKTALNDSSTYTGKLMGLDGDKVILKSKNIELSFNYDNIKRANLVFTEEMFRALLNKKK
jgi:ribosome maturation factor RimP